MKKEKEKGITIVGKQEPNIINNWLDENGNIEIAKQVEKEAKDLCEQETLEEALKQILDKRGYYNSDLVAEIDQLYKQEQDKNKYSEEEVESIIQKLMNDVHYGDLCYGDNVIDFKLSPRQWFEQFKNK
jgi:hypothetical protein